MPLSAYTALAEEIRSRVFGRGTDLHASFTTEEVAVALEMAHEGRLSPETSTLAEAYGIADVKLPELVSLIAETDVDSLRNTLPSPDRLAKASALRLEVATLLRDLPKRFPGFCPDDFREVGRDGLYAVVVETEGQAGGPAGNRRVRAVEDKEDLLGGESVQVTSSPDGQWHMVYVLQRGCSLENARSMAEEANKAGPDEHEVALRGAALLRQPAISPPPHDIH